MIRRQSSSEGTDNPKRTAYHFIVLMGIVSLFGDITYEGARSITGPYLAVLGASAGIVGFASGLGEFVGYAFRLISGYYADRTKSYWPITIAGYALILSIPLLAFVYHWWFAVVLIIFERLGKAVRTPARDTILSHATKQVGRGWGFALHEALDQVGAFIGPFIFTAVFILEGSYRAGFNILWIPAFLTLIFLFAAKARVPSPEKLEMMGEGQPKIRGKLSRTFWFYTLFIFLTVAGFAHFQIISYHFKVHSIVSDVQIPIFYAIAMGTDALVALAVGKIYDKIGLKSLIAIPLLTLPIPFFAFSESYVFAVISVVLWGAVMGIHETTMRAAIADLTPLEKRGFAYGLFNTAYGASWLFGGTLMGVLYDLSPGYINVFVVAMELIAITSFFIFRKQLWKRVSSRY